MSFGDAIKVCLTKYVDFNGRASRSELWWFFLFSCLAAFVAAILDETLLLLVYLGLLLPTLAVEVRRLHDLNKSGWWILLAFVPIGNIVVFVWFCMRGTVGDNRFGPDTVVAK